MELFISAPFCRRVPEWCIFHTNRKGKLCANVVTLTVNYLNLDQITCMFYPPTPTGLQGNEAAVV